MNIIPLNIFLKNKSIYYFKNLNKEIASLFLSLGIIRS